MYVSSALSVYKLNGFESNKRVKKVFLFKNYVDCGLIRRNIAKNLSPLFRVTF